MNEPLHCEFADVPFTVSCKYYGEASAVIQDRMESDLVNRTVGDGPKIRHRQTTVIGMVVSGRVNGIGKKYFSN